MLQVNKYSFAKVHPRLLLDKLGLHAIICGRLNDLKIMDPNPRGEWEGDRAFVFKTACQAYNSEDYLQLYLDYYKEWLTQMKSLEKMGLCRLLIARLKSRLVLGLSCASAMEAGISLHYTYGVPVIPGSSVKGACRAAGEAADCDKDLFLDIYGSIEKKKESRSGNRFQVGKVTFFDALPCNWKGLELDVMTPHHTKYYKRELGYKDAPDVEDPVPVLFLAVPKETCFLFSFASKDGEFLNEVEQHWEKACEEGFGGKTSSGYGWFEVYQKGVPDEFKNESKPPKIVSLPYGF
jgi:CRISPR-associated protein Cmr6